MKGVNKRCNYVMVMDWMYDNFDLNVAEANALGIVYGFCQDGESWYRGGSSYIAARLHISQKSVKNYLNDFTKRGILTMKKIMVGNVECNAYQTVPGIETLVLRKDADPGKNFPGEKFSPVKNFPSDPGKIFPQERNREYYGEIYSFACAKRWGRKPHSAGCVYGMVQRCCTGARAAPADGTAETL